MLFHVPNRGVGQMRFFDDRVAQTVCLGGFAARGISDAVESKLSVFDEVPRQRKASESTMK
jgi:hypothetical protein